MVTLIHLYNLVYLVLRKQLHGMARRLHNEDSRENKAFAERVTVLANHFDVPVSLKVLVEVEGLPVGVLLELFVNMLFKPELIVNSVEIGLFGVTS